MASGDDPGHLFIIQGDLTTLDCGAVLVPTDRQLRIERPWDRLVDALEGEVPTRWPRGRRLMVAGTLSDGPDVWLADIGTDGPDEPGWYVDPVVAFVGRAADRLRRSGRTRRVRHGLPPRVAVPMVGTRFGGSRRRKGELFLELVARLHDAALEHACDVVLVTYRDKAFAAAQRARQLLQPSAGSASDPGGGKARDWWPSIDDDQAAHAERLAQRNWHGELVLFLGAGASMSAGLPSWQGLLDDLCDAANALGHEGTPIDQAHLRRLDLRDQAAIVRRAFPSSSAYGEALRRALASARYSLVHGLLASLHVHETITTNYDDLYELACDTPGRRLAVLPYEVAKPHTAWLLKLHGSVHRPESMVVTREDYLGLPERAGALYGILQAMLLTEHLLFVGYSLSDEPFHRVMHEVRRAMPASHYRRLARGEDKAGTVLLLEHDELLARLWRDDLSLVAVGERLAPPRPDDAGDQARHDDELAARGRQLEIFLDLLAYESADVAHFILDPSYRDLLQGDEPVLASLLQEAGTRAADMDTPVARRIRELMATHLGWTPPRRRRSPSDPGSTPPT